MSVFSAASVNGTTYPAGADFSTFIRADGQLGMDPSFVPLSSGIRTILEHIVRRWIMVPGEMHDKSIGADILSWLNKPMTELQKGMLRTKLREQARNVEGVDDARVLVDNTTANTLNIQGQVTLGNNQKWTFVFVLTADKIDLITLASV